MVSKSALGYIAFRRLGGNQSIANKSNEKSPSPLSKTEVFMDPHLSASVLHYVQPSPRIFYFFTTFLVMCATRHLCCSCGTATSECFGDVERNEADRNNEDNAEDDDDTSLLASPVISLEQLAGGFAYLKCGDSGHFEYSRMKSQLRSCKAPSSCKGIPQRLLAHMMRPAASQDWQHSYVEPTRSPTVIADSVIRR